MKNLELIANGYGTIEGPTVDAEGGLYFSDIPNGGVYRLSPTGEITTVVPRRKGVGGICLHKDGGIVVAGRDLSHVNAGQSRTVLAPDEITSIGGPGIVGGFNDIHADDEGRVFAGSVRRAEDGTGMRGELVLARQGHDPVILYDGVKGNNGIAFDWENRRLYHCASYDQQVIVSEFVSSDQVRILKRISTEAIDGIPDGLALDSDGFLWIAFYGGGCVVRFDPDGKIVQKWDMPAEKVTSLCFSGEQRKEIVVVTEDNTEDPSLGGSVFRASVDIDGGPVGSAGI